MYWYIEADGDGRHVSLRPLGHRVSSAAADKRDAPREDQRGNATGKTRTDVCPGIISVHDEEARNILTATHRYEKLLGAVKTELLQLAHGETHWQMAKLLLGWLVCAKRPLKWHEMQSILSYDPVNQRVDFDNKMLRQNAKKYLGSLVHVLDGDHIRIIHSTARR